MRKMKCTIWLAAVVAAALTTGYGHAQQVTGAYWFADKPFPEYIQLWQEGWSLKDENGEKLIYARPNMPLGGYVFVYFKNTTAQPIKLIDIKIQGIRLSEALAQDSHPERAEDRYRSSLLISKLPKQQIDKLKDAGWPVWWKPEPPTVEPGGYGEIVIRLRRVPKPARINVEVHGESARFSAEVAARSSRPWFETISFSPDLRNVYLYPRHPNSGMKPTKVLIDGRELTRSAAISWSKSTSTAAVVVRLKEPLKLMSYHNFRVAYSDGSCAQAGIRAWGHEMVYGMWSSPAGGDDPESATKSFIEEYARHNINAVMPYVVGVCRDYFHSDAGWEYCARMGVERMLHWPDGKHDALFLFAMDEPDANDAAFNEIDDRYRLGSHGQWLVKWTAQLHKSGPNSPVLLNIDNTYKPENWYMYHQLADIPCVDPYYTEQQDFAARGDPFYFGFHTRPTYVQAVCTISQSSCRPKPLHVILCSTRYTNDEGYQGRYPTPEEKRMEVYYAIGSGAKGISYWWFPKDKYCHGLDERTAEANALWKEIGLLGAEVRTAGPLITTSCPVELPIKATRFLWVRALLCGTDTVALSIVNENAASDRLGTIVKPVENARVSVELPSWMAPKSIFHVTCDGLGDVAFEIKGRTLSLDLGRVNLSRFIVVTSDPGLRTRLQKRYDEMFARNVARLKGEG